MAKNYVQPGERITFTAAAAVTSGQAVVLGALLGVSLNTLAPGEQGEAAIEEVWELPCAAAADIASGDKLTWSVAAGEFVLSGAATGDLVGCAVATAAAGSGVATVLAKLTPGAGAVQGD